MSARARNYTSKTLKRLFGLSGNQCAFPGCNKPLVNENNALDSNICHIEAACEGGERYNPEMSDPERADYENLILLCIQHHDETNDVEKYTVDVLKKMKLEHESNLLAAKITSRPSMLSNAVNAIADIELEELDESQTLLAPDPLVKISHNNIKRNSTLIHEYKVYHHKLNAIYDELEMQGSIRKGKLLRNIKTLYTTVKGRYVLDSSDEMTIIRAQADDIFDDVYDELVSRLDNTDMWEEDIMIGVRLIMVDAFVRCKVLEEPPK